MAYIENVRILHAFPEDYGGEYVVRCGRIALPETLAPEKLHDMPAPSPAALEEVHAAPAAAFGEGLLFLIDDQDPGLDMQAVQAVQKEYLYRYYKEIVLPRRSPFAPAAKGVRRQSAPEIVRLTSKLRNMPFLLRYPLVQKLQEQKCSMPVLLLLPGPSLPGVAAHLAQLAKSHVIVAVSRSIGFCLAHGVEPDFVVQLDTYLMQRHFYDTIPRLPNTALIALSVSPMHCFAHLFHGVLFMESFDHGALPNPYRMRENGLSTLMGCLGFAECLHAPYAILAGVDLSYPGKQNAAKYYGSDAAEADRPCPPHFQNADKDFFLGDRNGKGVFTSLNYIAVAREAEHFARSIRQDTGTRFYLHADSGILCPRHFPRLDLASALDAPPLDRGALLQRIDHAISRQEEIKHVRVKVDCAKTREALEQNLLILEACRLQGTPLDPASNPIRLFAEQERDFNLPDNDTLRLAFSIKIARQWRDAALQAHNIALAHMLARRNGAIHLVCLIQEKQELPRALYKLFPGFQWIFHGIFSIATPLSERAPDDINAAHLQAKLPEYPVVCVTPKAREVYRYHFEVYPADNLFYLEPQHMEGAHEC